MTEDKKTPLFPLGGAKRQAEPFGVYIHRPPRGGERVKRATGTQKRKTVYGEFDFGR